MKIIIISEGRPGHYNQSVSLARSVGLDYEIKNIPFVDFRTELLRLFDNVVSRDTAKKLFIKFFGVNPDNYVGAIGTGNRVHPFLALFKRATDLPTISIFYPKLLPDIFDMIIVPYHDRAPDNPGVYRVFGAIYFKEKIEDTEISNFRSRLKSNGPWISIIIGGNSKHHAFNSDEIIKGLELLFKNENLKAYRYLLSTSRRTPQDLEELIEKNNYPIDFSVYYHKDKTNPLRYYFEISDFAIITADSISMITEAINCGVFCYCLRIPEKGKLKFDNSFETLEKQGFIKLIEPEELGDIIKKNRINFEVADILYDKVRKLFKI
ncbi:ELM1/GtrOC1 family putative glycosyltransferase [Thermodesulfobium sp. 4217-1]|uniref:ELM1/GtrOC1 family putative glycosyltransferase n=1 Tax=Thermodesulfobium sp. 4217-1 TaxID=3120013 RepID=UPI0032215ADC